MGRSPSWWSSLEEFDASGCLEIGTPGGENVAMKLLSAEPRFGKGAL